MADSPGPRGGWSRRRFLDAVGRAGGAAALYETMTAMGLVRIPSAFAGPPDLSPTHGQGKRIVILGAGVAGLCAAYELSKGGYEVIILEAQKRPGGRSFTVRRGDVIEEITGSKQVCRFDEGPQMYLNAGPGRLPYHHTAILHYCNVLGVPLEVYNMMTRANFFQNDDAFAKAPMLNRRIANDTRGWIADLLAKAVMRGSLNDEVPADERAGLLKLLASFGDIDPKESPDYDYLGSSRSGYAIDPNVVTCGEVLEPLKLSDLLTSQFWENRFYQAEEYEWQPTLFQPVHGMDQIVKGFVKKVGKYIHYGREVYAIHNDGEKVKVSWRPSGSKGAGETLTADWCISTIPLPILEPMDTNFSDEYKKAIAAVKFASTCKVGWQSNARFWETKNQMYGGISYTTDDITQMWYPSYDYFGRKGILTGAYNYDDAADELAAQKIPQRLTTAMNGAKKLHPDFDKYVPKELGLSIAWKNVPYQLGGWADDWGCDDTNHTRLLKPEGRFWVAGDQVSYLSGWQEGAVRSAHLVIDAITKPQGKLKTMSMAPPPPTTPNKPLRKAPGIRRRTRGLP
jgi:monoamine oxidase